MDGVCKKCGCTNERACPGGCYWVEPDLCSACVTFLEDGSALAWDLEGYEANIVLNGLALGIARIIPVPGGEAQIVPRPGYSAVVHARLAAFPAIPITKIDLNMP